jgi:hypothetical protein
MVMPTLRLAAALVVLVMGWAAPVSQAEAADLRVVADFNADGFDDLAVGVPYEDVTSSFGTSFPDAGAVNVIYGSSSGLTSTGNQMWTQCVELACARGFGIQGAAEAGDGFGWALAWGDFNGDSFDDLAVGVPLEDLDVEGNSIGDAGAVNVIYGSTSGLTSTGNQFWNQDSHSFRAGIADSVEPDDRFGSSLAAANMGFDLPADLAVGVPFEDLGAGNSIGDAGAVNVIYGSSDGLKAGFNSLWTQDSAGIVDSAEFSDHFGAALAAANFGNGSPADLAVGAPSERLGADNSIGVAGAVNVIYGSSARMTSTGNQFWTQDSSGIANAAESFDGFGSSLAAANLGNGLQADLAVGVPFEDLGADNSIENAGAVNVIYGSSSGLTSTGNRLRTQDSSGIADSAEHGDEFGYSLAAANLGNGPEADLAVGVPFEGLGAGNSIHFAGAANVIYGSSAGLTSTGNQLWTQDSAGIVQVAEFDDRFGSSLAAANFGNDPDADLAVGVPFEDLGAGNSTEDAGAANVIYGSSAGLTSTGNRLWTQDSSDIAGSAEPFDEFGYSLA